jgi:hypothetical protein
MRLPALFVVLVSWAYAQSPQVPSKMNFAGMTLHIKEDARKEIQKDVDALTQYPKYFQIKVDRAKRYLQKNACRMISNTSCCRRVRSLRMRFQLPMQ